MGDRANIVMRYDKDQTICLYTHWGGEELPATLQRALAKRWRWDDEAYLARIIFDEMVNGTHGQETGHGISPEPPDNEHDWLIVDCATKRVERRKYHFSDQTILDRDLVGSWSFAEFCALDLNSAFGDY